MSRARLPLFWLFALPLAACGKDPSPVPAPEPRPSAVAEVTPALTATATAPAPTAAPTAAPTILATAAPTIEATAAPTAVVLSTAEPAPKPPEKKSAPVEKKLAGGAIALPAAKSGILPPGAADKVIKVGAPAIVKLIDAGAEPKSELAYALVKGASPKLAMKMDMAMTLKMAGQALPETSIPRITVLLDLTAGEKKGNEWEIGVKLSSISVDGKGAQQEQIAAAMRPQVETLKGLGMDYWLSSHGAVRDMKVDIPKGFPAQAQQVLSGMNQSFESMVAPLPSEAVGLGAEWQVVSRMASSGADLVQTATYTLKARDGNKATLDFKVTQYSASDTIKVPGMPEGMAAHVKSFNSGGSGTTHLDITSVAPESDTRTMKTAMEMSVQGGGAGGEDSSVETKTTVQSSRP